MARPGTARSGTNGRNGHHEERELFLNFRVEDSMFAGVERFADANNVSRSEACRLLIAASLEDRGLLASAREIGAHAATFRKVFTKRLLAAVAEAVPQALSEAKEEADGGNAS